MAVPKRYVGHAAGSDLATEPEHARLAIGLERGVLLVDEAEAGR